MRGHVRRHGRGWAVVIDLGSHVPCQRCENCHRRYWLDAHPLARCPRCEGDLRRIDARRQQWHCGLSTRAEAERLRTSLLARVDDGRYVAPSRLTLESFLKDEWLPAKRAAVKPSTWASYDLQTQAYIAPSALGSMALGDIDGPRLTAFYGRLLEHGRRDGQGGLSAKTVRNIHGMLHKAFADAVKWGRLSRNPGDAAEQPRRASLELTVWTSDELHTFLDRVRSDDLFAAWQLLATTGMRRGEVLGLRWSDVDLERGCVTVRQTRVSVRYVVQTTSPKTERGMRTIGLDPTTLATLRTHRRRQLEDRLPIGESWPDTNLVFVRRDGSPIHPQRFTEWFNQRVRKAGLPPIRLHDVRHSYATAVIRAGVPLKVVSQRIGHASPTITMTIYQAVLPGDDEAAALVGAREILGTQ